MSTLRVVLTAPPSPADEFAWTLFDAQERVVKRGRGAPGSWPEAARREAVCAAATVRIVNLALPPMPADRIAAAATYALEDQLAGPAHAQHLTVSARDARGGVQVIVIARALVASLRSGFARVFAEPSLAPVPQAGQWHWLASAGGGSFVRRPDGSAFAAGPADTGGKLPEELTLALAQARRNDQAPATIAAAFAVDDARLAAWAAQCGVRVIRIPAWRWDDAGARIADAPDLAMEDEQSVGDAAPARDGRGWRIAAALLGAALVLQVGATVTHWTLLQLDLWRAERATVATATQSGVAAADSAAAAAGLAKRYVGARHRAGLSAPGDALPLLARAAPALGALPAGVLRNAAYAPEHWTFDFAKLDPAVQATLDRKMSGAGLATLQVATAGGLRMRVTPAPGMTVP